VLIDLDDYDWEEVFSEGNGGNCSAIMPRRIPGEKCSLASFCREDVKEICGLDPGEKDVRDWIIWGILNDGRYFFVCGGCDYMGWDCHAQNYGNVAETAKNLIRFAMSDEERRRFGLHLGDE